MSLLTPASAASSLKLPFAAYLLALPFKDAHLYSEPYKLGSRRYAAMSAVPGYGFQRASKGLARDAAGLLRAFAPGAPRITDRGLLVEEARSNVLLRSAAIGVSPWTGTAAGTNDTTDVTAPDGSFSATKMIVTAGLNRYQDAVLTSAAHSVKIALRTASGTASVLLSCFLAASPYTSIGSRTVTVTSEWQFFDFVTTAPPAAGQVYRFGINFNSAATVYAWGADSGPGAFALSPIISDASAAARGADQLTFAGLDVAGDFTFLFTMERQFLASGRAFDLNDGAGTNRIWGNFDTAGNVWISAVLAGGATLSSPAILVPPDSQALKVAIVKTAAGVRLFARGQAGALQAWTGFPAFQRLMIGHSLAGAPLNTFAQFAGIMPRAMTTAEAQAATL